MRIDRLMANIEQVASGCWLWRMWVDKRTGYSLANVNNKTQLVHRVAYELFKGPIPVGLEIDHLCRVRHCVNPQHLEAVTRQENIRRGDSGKREREKTHCKFGHPYDGDNTYQYGRSRYCRECNAASHRRARAERAICSVG